MAGASSTVELLSGSSPVCLEPLREAGGELWRRDPTATPFQHPAWLIAWWKHLGAGALRTLVLRRNGAVAAVLPMAREDRPSEGRWTFLGTGISDYLGGVFDPSRPRELARDVLRWLASELPEKESCAWLQ